MIISEGAGQGITGNIPEIKNGSFRAVGASSGVTNDASLQQINVQAKADIDLLVRAGGILLTDVKYSQFGDATAADVKSGKKFTSAAGYQVVGTMNGIDLKWANQDSPIFQNIEIICDRNANLVSIDWGDAALSSYNIQNIIALTGLCDNEIISGDGHPYIALLNYYPMVGSGLYMDSMHFLFQNGTTWYQPDIDMYTPESKVIRFEGPSCLADMTSSRANLYLRGFGGCLYI